MGNGSYRAAAREDRPREGMTVLEIVKFRLEDDSREQDSVMTMVIWYIDGWEFGGLYNDECGCGCRMDALAPCSGMRHDCRAGVEVPCEYDPDDDSPARCYGDCDYHIVPREDKEGGK